MQQMDFMSFLDRVVDFATALVKCDSCLIYVLEGSDLVLRASKMNRIPEVVDRLKLRVGQGITGWVAEHRGTSRDSGKTPRRNRVSSRFMSFPKIVTKPFCPYL